jgi:hypothetical protein
MNDRITESRARLYGALVALLEEGHVSKYVPKQVVSPCIWIERHTWSQTREQNAAMITLAWRIVVATDADDDQEWLDVLSAKVHDAAVRAKFRPLTAGHQSIDIGTGPTTVLVITVDESIAVSTLCLPDQPTPEPIDRKLVSA